MAAEAVVAGAGPVGQSVGAVLLHVRAGAEGAPGAGEHNAPDRRVSVDRGPDIVESGRGRGVDRVQALRPV